MAFKDLREFIDELERRGWLKRIKVPVDAELEITEITDRVSKFRDGRNVALLFENVRGYDMPVLMNQFGSYERMALALGVVHFAEKPHEYRQHNFCRQSGDKFSEVREKRAVSGSRRRKSKPR